MVKMAMEPHHGIFRAWVAASAETQSPAGLKPVRPREARSAGGATVVDADTAVSEREEITDSVGVGVGVGGAVEESVAISGGADGTVLSPWILSAGCSDGSTSLLTANQTDSVLKVGVRYSTRRTSVRRNLHLWFR